MIWRYSNFWQKWQVFSGTFSGHIPTRRTLKPGELTKKKKRRTNLMNLFRKRTFILFVGISVSLCLCSCKVTPTTNDRETIAYSGNDQTAGILGFNEDGSLRINESARVRYNSYIERFGRDTVPATSKDFGIKEREDGNYDLTLEGAERWKKMKIIEDRKRIDDSDKLLNL